MSLRLKQMSASKSHMVCICIHIKFNEFYLKHKFLEWFLYFINFLQLIFFKIIQIFNFSLILINSFISFDFERKFCLIETAM